MNMPASDAQSEIHLGLLLIDDFALLSYASLIEPFRAANALGGRARYRWTHFSVDGGPVAASNGAMVLADRRVGEEAPCDLLGLARVLREQQEVVEQPQQQPAVEEPGARKALVAQRHHHGAEQRR